MTKRLLVKRKESKFILESEAHPYQRFVDKALDHGYSGALLNTCLTHCETQTIVYSLGC